jgi:hypothetical protein
MSKCQDRQLVGPWSHCRKFLKQQDFFKQKLDFIEAEANAKQ